MKFEGNVEYIRSVLAETVNFTKDREAYIESSDLSDKSDFKKYNKQVCKVDSQVPSHAVIDAYIKKFGKDYRYQMIEHPIKELRSRTEDNVVVGRA